MAEVNWIEELRKCSVASMFERLYLEITDDAKLVSVDNRQFKLTRHNGRFVVFMENGTGDQSVTFTKLEASISVSVQGAEIMCATLGLNDEGQCRLIVRGQQRETWQFRHDALRVLFFSPTIALPSILSF